MILQVVCGEKTVISPGRVWVFFFQEADRPFIVQMSDLSEHATVSVHPGFISRQTEEHGMAEKDSLFPSSYPNTTAPALRT